MAAVAPPTDSSAEVVSAPREEAILREVVEALAPLDRRAGSDGEREAAQWLRERLGHADCEVQIEEAEFLDGWAGMLVPLDSRARRPACSDSRVAAGASPP